MPRVTDPRLIEQLEKMQGFPGVAPVDSRVTDPQLLADLNASLGSEQPGRDLVEEAAVIDRAGNVPVTMLTGDPETDRRMAQAAASRGVRRELTPTDLAKVSGIIGGLATAPVSGTPAAMLSSGLLGAGLSSESSPGGIAKDAAVSAVTAGGLSRALAALGRFGAGKVVKAEAKAAEMAAKKKDEEVRSALAIYRNAKQQESRAIENLLRAESTGGLTPEMAAELATLKASPAWADTVQSIAKNAMEDLPSMAGKTRSAKAEFQSLMEGADAAKAEEAARILSGSTAKQQVMDRLKRYGPRALAGALAGTPWGPAGVAIGATTGVATGPMATALKHMAKHPAVSRAFWDPVAKAFAAEAPESLSTLTPRAAALLAALRAPRMPVRLPVGAAEEE